MQDKAIQNMPVERLMCCPQVRSRFDEETLAGLAQTIKETGILQPLLVRWNGSAFVVVDGERRLRAAKMAGLREVPVIVDDRQLSESETVYRQFVSNSSRESLNPIEKSRALYRFMKLAGLSSAQAAVKCGMSPSQVSKLLPLLQLPETIQQQVASGALAATTAYALSREQDAGRQRELADQAASGGLTREAVTERTKPRKTNRKATKRQRSGISRNRVQIPLGGGRSVAVAGSDLTLSSIIDWLANLVERLRTAHGQSLELSEAIKMVAQQ